MATQLLEYTIHLTDKVAVRARVAELAATNGQLLGLSPDQAAVMFAAPKLAPTGAFGTSAPCITSPWFGSSANYPTHLHEFERKVGGWFGLATAYPALELYQWVGRFVYAGRPDGDEDQYEFATPNGPIGARFWIDGFELETGDVFGAAAGQPQEAQRASRHLGGYGWACRSGPSADTKTHATIAAGEPLNTGPKRIRERFYLRIVRRPKTSQRIHWFSGSITPGASIVMSITPTLSLSFANHYGDGTTIDELGQSGVPLLLNVWTKIDLEYMLGAKGYYNCIKNGIMPPTFSTDAGDWQGGLLAQYDEDDPARIISATLAAGHQADHQGAWDFDDWVGAGVPVTLDEDDNEIAFTRGRDFWTGTKIIRLSATGFAASDDGQYVGPGGANPDDWKYTDQRRGYLPQALETLASSPRLAVTTDALQKVDQDPQNWGVLSAAVGVLAYQASFDEDDVHTLEMSGAIGGTVDTLGASDVAQAGMVYSGTGPISPVAGLEIAVVGPAHALEKGVMALHAQVECLGMFHPEDYTYNQEDGYAEIELPGSGVVPPVGTAHVINPLHNAPYDTTPWAQSVIGAPALVVIHAGTYEGTGTPQDLIFRTPVQLLFVRSTTDNAWWVWHASGLSSGHDAGETRMRSGLVSRALLDPAFTAAAEDQQNQRVRLRLLGDAAAVNAPGVEYQFVAWCDPGERFSTFGALIDTNTLPTVASETPRETPWVPEAALVQQDGLASAGGQIGFHSKGLGSGATLHTINSLPPLVGLTLGSLSLTVPSGSLLFAGSQVAYGLFRRNDGSGDPGVANVLQLSTYTGDGSASRTVSFAPPSGRRPMFALVSGSNGHARWRDPSHSSIMSMNLANGANAGDGIIAGGVDSLQVGSLLNEPGVVYDVLCFPTCDNVDGNNGWGLSCESIPVAPIVPKKGVPPPGPGPGGPIIIPPVEPGGPTLPGIVQINPTGRITQCAEPSVLVVNMALSNIGVSKQLSHLTVNIEVSPEATVCRLHFDEDVRQVLRDFPWQFATRYAALVPAIGPAVPSAGPGPSYAPPNADWGYAYRAPDDMIFARRIVNASGVQRQWDMYPPGFRVGSDDVGPVIYTDTLTPVLEYTHLSPCACNEGDALFRKALSWRHAHSIAMPLTRDKTIAQTAWEMYQRLLRDARTSSAQEQQQAPSGDPDWITGRG